jgi:hypothetical protein
VFGRFRLTGPDAAAGPLEVCAANPRYFSANGTAVYLTGSHIWNNFHDGMGAGADCVQTRERMEFNDYLGFLQKHGHNLIRLWRWEHFKSQAAGGAFHLCMSPQPWPRIGPALASDGKPRFDLSQFDKEFFSRLRDRVIAAGERGIYVAVMFFEGWGLHLSPEPDNVAGHPFFSANNVNDISIRSIDDYQVLPLNPRVQALQEAYIRAVVEAVQDLPNVLYEVANESSGGGVIDASFATAMGFSDVPQWGDSTQWQHWVIDVVKHYETGMGYDHHPIGMTMQFPVPDQTRVNETLMHSPAEWISPGFDDVAHPGDPTNPSRWHADPPTNDGTKVIITDTDHYAPGQADPLWAWKSFLRGHHPILMDFGLIDGPAPAEPSPGAPPYAAFEAARYAMGDTLRFARRMDLTRTVPDNELSSTTYALANPGKEYLVLQPSESAAPFTVSLPPGTYRVEWFDLTARETRSANELTSGGTTTVTPPFEPAGPAVLHLARTT